jgi:hypothetical protein
MLKSAESVYEELGVKEEQIPKRVFDGLMTGFALKGYFRYHQDNFNSGEILPMVQCPRLLTGIPYLYEKNNKKCQNTNEDNVI